MQNFRMVKILYKQKQKGDNNHHIMIGSGALFAWIRNPHQLHLDFLFFVPLCTRFFLILKICVKMDPYIIYPQVFLEEFFKHCFIGFSRWEHGSTYRHGGPRICSPVTLFTGMGIENGKNGLGQQDMVWNGYATLYFSICIHFPLSIHGIRSITPLTSLYIPLYISQYPNGAQIDV